MHLWFLFPAYKLIISIMFITSRGGNKLAAEYKMHQHGHSSLLCDSYKEERKSKKKKKLLEIYVEEPLSKESRLCDPMAIYP